MRQEDATKITARCFHGEPASCSHPCPFFFDIRKFLERVKDGKFGLAYKLYRNATVFPAIVSRLCEAPCRAECQRGMNQGDGSDIGDGSICVKHNGDGSLCVSDIETAVVKYAKDRKPETYRIPPRDQRVAVIGAGLAGLSVALNLAQKAYPVTVFERGGKALWSWIDHTDYEYFLDEIKLQFSEVDVEFVFDKEISGTDDPILTGFDYNHDATDNTGIDPVATIAKGISISKDAETYLQVGRWPEETDILPEKHYLDHEDEPCKPMIIPADPASGYTKEEAICEASRCMSCDCRACMDACAMLGRYNKRPQKIAIEAYSDTKAAPPFSTCSLTRETYSCNLCGYCKSVCPVGVDLEKLFHLARTGRAETDRQPKAFHDFWLRDFEWHRTEGEFFSAKDDTNYLFFPGCKIGARSPSQVKSAAAFLKERYDAGVLLDCCGAPAYWAGENELFNEHIETLREKWESSGKPVFVFACAYCMRLFDEFLPEIEKVSIYELISASSQNHSEICFKTDGDGPCVLKTQGPSPSVLFDPCVAREFPAMEKAVRRIAEGMSVVISELPERNQCCGFGGHMRVANESLYDAIVETRSSADEAPYLVYCANCAGTFALAGKEHVHILDLVFPFNQEDKTEGDGPCVLKTHKTQGPSPSVLSPIGAQQWRDNAFCAKAALAELYGEIIPAPVKPWSGISLKIPASLLSDMNRRLILEDDLRETIYESELANEVFVNDHDGVRQCRLIRDVVTTWVQYKKNDADCYTIIDAWSHRMRFSDTD